ncbi:sulfite exporter TauE/SafE family protein [Acidithiobacillus sp. M4-SHS-6]|uniref:sulfite exporter TauE/SafE family protein n=1 Tax=Acidithiobacillus sp. M4-SHS-6 TaxID=3383024 RepID=UPI0039BDE5C7
MIISSFIQGEEGRLIILFLAGLGAGFINVLAGGGSLLTLPILILVGLNPVMANGTNRIGILLENLTATHRFHQRQLIGLKQGGMLALWTLPGVLSGTLAGVYISNLWFQRILVGVLIIGAITLLVPNKMGAVANSRTDGQPSPWLYPALVALGFYGGFIQAGIGFLFILVLRHLLIQHLPQVNAYKTLIIAIYTLPALLIFAWMGEVRWEIGATIAVGGVLGAWLASKVTLDRRGELWIKIAVMVMVGAMAFKLWV